MTNETIELEGVINLTGVRIEGENTFIAHFTIDGKEAKAEWSIEDLYCNLTDWSTLSEELADAPVVGIGVEYGDTFMVCYAKDDAHGADGWCVHTLLSELGEHGDDLATYLV